MIAVTGANGFLGRHLVARLRAAGRPVRAVISERPGAERELPEGGAGSEVRRVDVRRAETLRGVFDGCEAVVHTVAVPTERAQSFGAVEVGAVANVVAEAGGGGAGRLVHVSAIGADPASSYPYLRSKGEGQALVARSGIPSVVLRPSLLFGEGDDFFHRLVFSLAFPIVPVPGDGKARFQPLHVDDLAAALLAAASRPPAAGRGGHQGRGPQPLTYHHLLAATKRGPGQGRPVLAPPGVPI